eukprot:TRINITY_DN1039_c1_g1_i1.p1 TRINITY_DN1039_c1_g1~~TRINITY_DN1039_c1_g1_i1.p1  ORF type:complete len:633 (+),score=65.21 TRINITY_DN1039_c1_g1_i1:444-2342(+)
MLKGVQDSMKYAEKVLQKMKRFYSQTQSTLDQLLEQSVKRVRVGDSGQSTITQYFSAAPKHLKAPPPLPLAQPIEARVDPVIKRLEGKSPPANAAKGDQASKEIKDADEVRKDLSECIQVLALEEEKGESHKSESKGGSQESKQEEKSHSIESENDEVEEKRDWQESEVESSNEEEKGKFEGNDSGDEAESESESDSESDSDNSEEIKADPALTIRISYTPEQKKKIYQLLNSRSVEDVFQLLNEKIPLKTLYKWDANRKKGNPPTNKKRGGKKIQHPELEEALYNWFIFQRARKIPVTDKLLQSAALKIAKELRIENFKASMGFIQKFKERNNLVKRSHTRFATKTASAMTPIIAKFFTELNVVISEYTPDKIWNYDEIPVYFEPLVSHTIAPRGSETVSILSVQAQQSRMTLVTAISAEGRILPPVLLYLSKRFTEFSLGGALIIHNKTGYVNGEILHEKILPFLLQHIEENSFLLFDDHKAHTVEEVKDLLGTKSIKYAVIPGGATCLLQPVDCGIGKAIKAKVKAYYQKWILEEFEKIITPEGRRKKTFKKPTNEVIAQWIMKSYSKLDRDIIKQAFITTGILSKEDQTKILDEKVKKFFVCKTSEGDIYNAEESDSDQKKDDHQRTD